MNRFYISILILLALITGLAACGQIEQRGEIPSEDWSRSIPLGEDVIGSIGLFVEGSGERVHIVWPYNPGTGVRFRYIQLDEIANQIVGRDLNFTGQLKCLRVLGAGSGSQHLFWASRLPGELSWTLWHALLDKNGDLVENPQSLSPPDVNVGNYVLAPDQSGGAVIVWDRGDSGELLFTHIDREGNILVGPLAIVVMGEEPSMSVDPSGVLHLAWLDSSNFYYGQLNLNNPERIKGTQVIDLPEVSLGDTLKGPILGYADDWVYIFWSILSYSDLEEGTASTEYLAFPADEPVENMSVRLWMLAIEEQPYADYTGSFSLTQLSPPVTFSEAASEYGQNYIRSTSNLPPGDIANDWEDVSGAVSDYLTNPAMMTGNRNELAVALASSQQYRLDSRLQIAAAVFSNGQYKGYSLASRTRNISDNPTLAVDEGGDLHLVWREGAGGKSVFYATTAPDAKTALDALTSSDIYNFLLMAGVESLASVAFMPVIGFFWLLPGLIFMGVWKLFRDQGNLSEPSSWVLLVIAISIYYVIKVATLPTLLTYIPFSAWLHVPADFELILRFGIPLIIFGIALLVANMVRQRYFNSAIFFYIAFVLTDAILTLMVYGVNFLGVF